MPKSTTRADATFALLQNLVRALDAKKAEDFTVLHVSAQSSITDYLILATGNSEPHLRALRIEAEKVLDQAGTPIAGMEQGGFGSGWTVVDAYQIMIHFFTRDQRSFYALDKLWKDATPLNIDTLISPPKPPVKKTPAKKIAEKKTPAMPAPTKKILSKKPAAKKTSPVKKTVTKKTPAKKTPASKKTKA